MQTTLILFFSNDDLTQVSWVLLNETGTLLRSLSNSSLKDVPSDISDVTVIVPATQVLLTEVMMPPLRLPKILQALPYALEEQLLEDVTQLHFAIGEISADQPLAVAVVAKQKMDAWLNALKEANIIPTRLFSAIFLLPERSANSVGEYSLVRTGPYSGFTLETVNLDLTAETSIQKTAFTEQQLLEQFAKRQHALPVINLLQKPYLPKRKTTQIKKVWRNAAYLGLGWLALTCLSALVSIVILNHHLHLIDAKINHLYQQHFPNESLQTVSKHAMQERMKQLDRQGNSNSFLMMLATLGEHLSKAPGIRLQKMDYHSHQLTLDISATSFEKLDGLTALLAAQGLSVKQKNASIVGTEVTATLLINRGSA